MKAERVKLEGPERRLSTRSAEGSRAELGQFLETDGGQILRKPRRKKHFLPSALILNLLSVSVEHTE